MHHNTRQAINISKKTDKKNKRHHKQENWNVGSPPGDITIRICGKYHYGPDNQTRNGTVYSCSTFKPNIIKPHQVNQGNFPEELDSTKNNLTNKNIEKSMNATMGHLHMRRQGLKSTREIPQYTDMKYKSKTNLVFYTTVDHSTMKEGKFTQIYADSSSSHQAQ